MLLYDLWCQVWILVSGELVWFDEQDCVLWDCGLIVEGFGLVEWVLVSCCVGFYILQVVIVVVYVQVLCVEDIDWVWIVVFYDVLLYLVLLLVIEFNCVVVLVMCDGVEVGLVVVDVLLVWGELVDYYLVYLVCVDFCCCFGCCCEVCEVYCVVLVLVCQELEWCFIEQCLCEFD